MTYAWDPLKTNAQYALSNGDRTATALSQYSNRSVTADWSKDSGQWYWELEITTLLVTGDSSSYGICDQDTGTDFTTSTRTGWNESWALLDSTPIKVHDGVNGGNYGSNISQADIIMFALDMDNNRVWMGKNGTWFASGDPEAGTGYMYQDATIDAAISCCITPYRSGNAVTSCFRASELNYTPPTGFYAIDADAIDRIDGISDGIGFSDTSDASLAGHGRFSAGIGISDGIGIEVEYNRGSGPGIGFNDETGVFGHPPIPLSTLGMSGETGVHIVLKNTGISNGIGFNEGVGAQRERTKGISDILGFSDAIGCTNYTQWLLNNQDRSVYLYYATITGAADGKSDYVFTGLKSFQVRSRSGDPSYLGISIVYSTEALTAITDRPNGELILEMAATVSGVESLREELIRTTFDSVRYDKGSQNQSITLTGYSTVEHSSSRIKISGVIAETMLSDGRMQYQLAKPDFYLRPGNTAIIGSDEIAVGMITYTVSPTTQSMLVQEA